MNKLLKFNRLYLIKEFNSARSSDRNEQVEKMTREKNEQKIYDVLSCRRNNIA